MPHQFVNAAVGRLTDILNLSDIANRGTTFHIQQIDIKASKITVQANAYIEQFPSNGSNLIFSRI
ncbi:MULTISPECIES: hypothetical protein [Aerosakkonema]|uniref:hypothetical protein n=1 Tax=Aerosakkonema TaxID=1246629 RepID=UPI0035BB4B1D